MMESACVTYTSCGYLKQLGNALGANEEEASENPSGLAVTILRAAFRSRIYVSNRETYPALTKALQKGGVHIHPHMQQSHLGAGHNKVKIYY